MSVNQIGVGKSKFITCENCQNSFLFQEVKVSHSDSEVFRFIHF